MLRPRILCSSRLSLRLLPRLIDVHRDLQSLPAASETCPAYRSGAKIVEADGNPYMRISGANSVRRIKADPSKSFYIRLCPGVPGFLRSDAVGAVKMSPDVTCGEVERARGSNEDVCDVLADAAPE